MMEALTCIRRAGADIVITYFAKEAARFDHVTVDPVTRRKLYLLKQQLVLPASSRPIVLFMRQVPTMRGSIVDSVQPAVSRQVDAAAAALRRHGLRVRDVEVPEMEWTVATQLVTPVGFVYLIRS